MTWIILILYLTMMGSGATVIIITLHNLFYKNGKEIVPGPRRAIEKLGWWYLPCEMGMNGLTGVIIIFICPVSWSIILLSLWAGFNLGVLYRDYYSIKFHKESETERIFRVLKSISNVR